jgi:hypothetical protein
LRVQDRVDVAAAGGAERRSRVVFHPEPERGAPAKHQEGGEETEELQDRRAHGRSPLSQWTFTPAAARAAAPTRALR